MFYQYIHYIWRLMFGEPRLQEICFQIINRDKKLKFAQEIIISQSGQICFFELLGHIKHHLSLKQDPLLFYYDHQQQIYIMMQAENLPTVHYSLISSQGTIELRIQEKISDEVMANSNLGPEEPRQKRSPERDIAQAFQLVSHWRELYRKGTINSEGHWQKVNLERGAAILNTPRKTLQDYFLLLRQGFSLGFNFFNNKRSKIGILRSFIKENKKQEKQKEKLNRQDEQKILRRIGTQLYISTEQEQMQQELFNVINHSSSDEDSVMKNQQLYEQPQN